MIGAIILVVLYTLLWFLLVGGMWENVKNFFTWLLWGNE